MQTQILPRPVSMDAQQRATLRCPQCGRTRVADVTRYVEASQAPKVKCACGHRFRVPLAPHLSTRYACQACMGKGYRIVERGKKGCVAAAAYDRQRHEKVPCVACHGLGARYPQTASGGVRLVLHRSLAFLATHTLAALEWLAARLGRPKPAFRTWLTMDLTTLGKLDVMAWYKRKKLPSTAH